MEKGTQTWESEILVHVDPITCHKNFLKRVWWGGGFPAWMILPTIMLKDSTDESGTGGIRKVPGGVQEEILSSELGKYIEYTLKRKLFMPVSYHRGRVSFYEAGPGVTRVCWKVSYTPFPFLNWAFQMFLTTFDLFFLPELKKACLKEQNKKSSQGGFFGFFFKALIFSYLAFMISRASKISGIKPTYPSQGYLDTIAQLRQETSDLNAVLSQNTYLVIGGTGFTGSALVQDLMKRGAKKVIVMGRSLPPSIEYPYGPSKDDHYPVKGVDYVRGDVTDLKALREAMIGVDVVFQTAAAYGFPQFGQLRGGDETEKINLGGMKNIFQAAKESKTVKQIIYTSSCDTVFAAKDVVKINETHPYLQLGIKNKVHADGELAVGDHYARTKILAEKFLLEKDNKDGIRTVSLRPNGIHGPGEYSWHKKICDVIFILGAFPFYFDEKQRTDWTCVYNLVYAHILATVKLSNPETANIVGGKAYFITDDEDVNSAAWQIFKPAMEAAGGPVRAWFRIPPWVIPKAGYVLELLEKFTYETFGYGIPPFITEKEGYKGVVTHTHDNSRARKELGYRPLITTGQCQAFTAEEMGRRYGWSS